MTEKISKTSAPKKTAARTVKASVAADVETEVKEVVKKKAAPAKSAVAARKPAAPRKPQEDKVPEKKQAISGEQRYRMIAEAAYFRAESRQFKSDPVRDWIDAERYIVALLGEEDK